MSNKKPRGPPVKDPALSMLASFLTTEITFVAYADGFTDEDIEVALGLGNHHGRKWRRYRKGEIRLNALIRNVVRPTLEAKIKISRPKKGGIHARIESRSPWLHPDWRAVFNPWWYKLQAEGIGELVTRESAFQALSERYAGDLTIDWLKNFSENVVGDCVRFFHPAYWEDDYDSGEPRFDGDRITDMIGDYIYHDPCYIQDALEQKHRLIPAIQASGRARALVRQIRLALTEESCFAYLVPAEIAFTIADCEDNSWRRIHHILPKSELDKESAWILSSAIKLIAADLGVQGSMSYRNLVLALLPRPPNVFDSLPTSDLTEYDSSD